MKNFRFALAILALATLCFATSATKAKAGPFSLDNLEPQGGAMDVADDVSKVETPAPPAAPKPTPKATGPGERGSAQPTAGRQHEPRSGRRAGPDQRPVCRTVSAASSFTRSVQP